MARHHFLLTLSALLCCGVVAFAQEPSDGPPVAPPPGERPPPPPDDIRADNKLEDHNVQGKGPSRKWRKRLEELSPEDREKVREKMRRWEKMPEDQKAHVRFVQSELEKRARKAIDEALQNSGLQLNDTERVKFSEIYRAERRKIEEELRAEMDRKRQERLPDLQKTVVERYKRETAKAPN